MDDRRDAVAFRSEEFEFDISTARETLGWEMRESVAGAVREGLERMDP